MNIFPNINNVKIVEEVDDNYIEQNIINNFNSLFLNGEDNVSLLDGNIIF